ncbi:E3 ubiquitin-protein ligase TRIM21-like [Centroberyx affinis]|uniref:E3 ubiquitin-protein ligase TRIM21-like n=1 Tax=Centroberyx affinis TaxID=166261 RepID=UPI003A5BCB13
MSAASSLLSEEQFLCPICLDVFTDPVTIPCGHNFCKNCITQHWDINAPCQCPMCKDLFKTRPKLRVNTFISEMAAQFRKSAQMKASSIQRQSKTEAEIRKEIQQMIRERQLKIQKIQHSVELSKEDADREIADSVRVFTALMQSVERGQAELIETIEEKQKTEKQAEGFIKELEQEISELMKRTAGVEQLSHTEDHLHLLQSFPSLNTPPHTKDWTEVSAHRSLYEGTVRRAVAQLEETLRKEMEKLLEAELKRVQQYAVDVTLDPHTAYPYLILSDDGKQVKYGKKKKLPNNTERFSSCACVLGKQSFSSGRFYYEVQVKGKSKWDLGVVRGSINRKGQIRASPKNGDWTIWLRNGNEYKALADPRVLLSLKTRPQKVGVFVDYEEGLVSFYDVDAAALIYSFTGCTFTEKLYPFFSPCNNDDGKNSAPLTISPVNLTD